MKFESCENMRGLSLQTLLQNSTSRENGKMHTSSRATFAPTGSFTNFHSQRTKPGIIPGDPSLGWRRTLPSSSTSPPVVNTNTNFAQYKRYKSTVYFTPYCRGEGSKTLEELISYPPPPPPGPHLHTYSQCCESGSGRILNF
jgi:hypothetical protein